MTLSISFSFCFCFHIVMQFHIASVTMHSPFFLLASCLFLVFLSFFCFCFLLSLTMTDISTTNIVPSTSNEIQSPNFLNLHPSENPTTPLVAPLFDGTNYHSWSRSMITALSAKNKVKFILGTTDPPNTNNSLFSTWH